MEDLYVSKISNGVEAQVTPNARNLYSLWRDLAGFSNKVSFSLLLLSNVSIGVLGDWSELDVDLVPSQRGRYDELVLVKYDAYFLKLSYFDRSGGRCSVGLYSVRCVVGLLLLPLQTLSVTLEQAGKCQKETSS